MECHLICHQALGEDLRGSCTDYHAEPGLGLSCNVHFLSLPNAVDPSVEAQCVRMPCVGSSTSPPLVSTAHMCQVHTIHIQYTCTCGCTTSHWYCTCMTSKPPPGK